MTAIRYPKVYVAPDYFVEVASSLLVVSSIIDFPLNWFENLFKILWPIYDLILMAVCFIVLISLRLLFYVAYCVSRVFGVLLCSLYKLQFSLCAFFTLLTRFCDCTF